MFQMENKEPKKIEEKEDAPKEFLTGAETGLVATFIILLLLGNLLMYIMPPLTRDNTFQELIKNELKQARTEGHGYSLPQAASFTKGIIINRPAIVGDTGLQASDITFVCGDNQICGAGRPITGIGNYSQGFTSLKIYSNIDAYFVVCANADHEPRYCIAVASTAAKATSDCATACDVH